MKKKIYSIVVTAIAAIILNGCSSPSQKPADANIMLPDSIQNSDAYTSDVRSFTNEKELKIEQNEGQLFDMGEKIYKQRNELQRGLRREFAVLQKKNTDLRRKLNAGISSEEGKPKWNSFKLEITQSLQEIDSLKMELESKMK